jgi:D-sedoheptulose 7-phosphate isomerase
MSELVERSLRTASKLLDDLRADADVLGAIDQTILAIERCFRSGGKVLACGNGGSMADAMHFCEEWTGRFRKERPSLPALALSDPTHLTCVANDYGFERVFERQVNALGKPGDVLLVLTTSGESPNLALAVQAAKGRGMHVVGFLGRGGGALRPLCDVSLVAPGETSDRIQELHMLVLHVVIEAVEDRLGY